MRLLLLLMLLLTSIAQAADPPKWTVDAPPGPSKDVVIDTDEGTWMSLDVSPDGKDVVFDLLGDIYLIPITGGEAKALTSGVAWDMQPRFSPDGKRIAFTSDRAGGDNLWIMDRDGSNPKQISKESFRLLNSPAWTPDGQYVAGRKHFTSHRSLGAGEIWLYHAGEGGGGVQMVKKPNDQKDLGEPAFSRDGKYLYYSLDATPGQNFEYNKDPNPGIYDIRRKNRETGETQTFINAPGGAARPTPSPDGRWLAFVKRDRYKTVLAIQDVVSGSEKILYDNLERDMQETWAIHGVYPTIAWTPDSKSIVFWAAGKIHRVTLNRQVTDIPFHVKTTRKITDAVRFPIDVAPPQFKSKMLRWITVSPDGNHVVFSALGYLWTRNLKTSQAKRLTKQTEHFEFYPAYSRDGRFIAYTTWNDLKLGSVRVIPAAGGASRQVTKIPGHYVEPAFSPDGKHLAWRAVRGGWITSKQYGHDNGIFINNRLVTRDGQKPQFGAENDRIYVLRGAGDDGLALVGLDFNGGNERTLFQDEKATDIVLAPDEKRVAFQENFHAYMAPLPRTGTTVTLDASSDAVPVTRVSTDSGNWLQWSGDSKKLYWSLGATLYESGGKEYDLGFTQTQDAPSGRTALTGARIVTMRGDEVIENGTVLTNGNRIEAVGASVPIPPGTKVYDVKGDTIIPGLVDVHWHGSQGSDGLIPQRNWVNYASLGFGVTTLHDPSNDTAEIFTASEMQKAGLILAPRIFSTGTILYGAAGTVKAEINSLEDARRHLRRMQAVGAFSVKSYNQPRRDQRQQVIEAARGLNMMVVPEGGSLFQHNMTMVVDGHTGVEHAIPVPNVYKDVVTLWSASGSGYTPTLVVGYGGIGGENYWYAKTNVWEDRRLLGFVPREIVDARSRRRTMAPDEEYNHLRIASASKKLNDAGVSVQLGAHGQREGLGAHWELWMFVQGGMTPLQALRAGTLSGARYLGLDRDIGSLEPGKLADLAVIRGNPLEDIRVSSNIRYVMLNGRLYDADRLDELAPRARPRPPFYFEDVSTPPR